MAHHWRASDQLEPTLRRGEWHLYDRGYLVGTIQWGRARGRPILRGLAPDGSPLGYAATLEEACDALWEWYRRVGRAPSAPHTREHAGMMPCETGNHEDS